MVHSAHFQGSSVPKVHAGPLHCALGPSHPAPLLAALLSQPKTLRDIRRDMHKQREWRNELDRMKISNVVRTTLYCLDGRHVL